LIPALATAKPELTEALKEGGRSSTTGAERNQVRNSLVIAEIALALVLLVGAGLLLKSYARVQNIDPGFDRRNVFTAEVNLPDTKYPQRESADYREGEAMINFWNEALRRLHQLPGVEAAGFTTILPLSGSNSDSSFSIEGRVPGKNEPGPDEEIRIVTPDYFRVLKTPLLRGRFFSESDNAHAPGVVIINEALAKKFWPDEDALGKRITFSDPSKPDPRWLTIVGIVRSDVLRLIVGHAAKLVGIGTLIGLILAFLSTRLLSALLYNVGAFDATTFLFVTVALAAVALLASYIPALRATRADPMIALSHNA
jgi:putative ABC transport system permease protein